MNKLYPSISSTLALLSLLIPATASAVPAKPELQPVEQPDGSIVMARLTGDEHGHFIVNSEGLPIGRNTDGLFYYYECAADGNPILSTQRVGDTSDVAAEKRFLATLDRSGLEAAFIRQMNETGLQRVRRKLPPQVNAFPCTGSPRGLVLLIEYSDVSFTVENPHDSFSRMLNEEGYSDYGAWGSARDWFISNSGGKFTPQFDVVGPIKLNHPRAWYGANKGGNDVRPEMMIIEACGLIADEVDFSLYDEDNDGFIDNIFAFYAGYGENLGVGAPSECVWPHSWDIADATSVPYYFNGKRLNHYACTNEIDLTDTMDGIGTFVHEFSHVMGLPDLYATNYSYAFTPGKWSVMDEGPYNNNSRTPPCYSAFERLSLGWLEPQQINGPATIKIPPISENQAFWIATENENEYYLLENRQQTGWDTFIPYHGMLVWHIDYNENIWHYNTVNDRKDHQYVDLIEADNHPHADTVESDAFPGLGNVTSFTDDTEPSMRSWAGKGCGVPLTDIFENNGYIYLKACGGKTVLDAIGALPASEVGIDSFTARWEASEETGCEYILSVYTASTTSGGQTMVSYVDGYEGLNLGSGVTSAGVTGLEPGGEYRYSVRVYAPESGLQSPPSNEITVSLLSPTFDYLMPVALDASDITRTGFTANWQTLPEADSYLLTIISKTMGEPASDICGFDDGLSGLPEGWATNSKLTYAAEEYCATAVPSLRMNTEGHYLEVTPSEGYVRGISFWQRTVGASADASMEILTRVAGEWKGSLRISAADMEESPLINITEDMLPFGGDALRIVFHPSGKGSIAIDDVTLYCGGETTIEEFPSLTNLDAGASDRFAIDGLRPGTPYYYTVQGVKDGIKSKASNEIRVVTVATDAVGSAVDHPICWSFEHATSTLSVRGMQPDERATIYRADGSVIAGATSDAEGAVRIRIPGHTDIFILRTATGHTAKVITRR